MHILSLGDMYYRGEGVPKDYSEAFTYYRKAAEMGHPVAQGNLGSCYSSGEGVAKDYSQAFKWRLIAAMNGDLASQSAVAALYEDGLGVPKDWVEAYAFYNVALSREGKNSRMLLDALEKKMAPEQVSRAQIRTKELVKEINSAANMK